MEIKKIDELLMSVALDHSEKKPDSAIQKIALALMHMAKGIEELQTAVARIPRE